MFGSSFTPYSPTSVFLKTKSSTPNPKASFTQKFFQFRSFASHVPAPQDDLALPRYRHELPFQPGVVNELPPNDWRNEPVRLDFERLKNPTNDYERFIARHVKSADSPYLKLTKGQFIVHMRRLAMEERAFRFPATFALCAGLVAGMVYSFIELYPDTDRRNTDVTQIAYEKMLQPAPLIPDLASNAYRDSADKFFRLPAERVAKLPKDLQDLYHRNAAEYNATHKGNPHEQSDRQFQHYLQSEDRVKALMAKHNLSAADIITIIKSCNQREIHKQVHGLPDDFQFPRDIEDYFHLTDVITPKLERGEVVTEDDYAKLNRPEVSQLVRSFIASPSFSPSSGV